MRVPPFAHVLARSGPDEVPFRRGAVLGTGATPADGTANAWGVTPVIAFCSDEDIARRAEADFPHLAGPSQLLARGADGTFPSAPGDPWTFASASVDFSAQGVQPGDVARLTFPRATASTVNYQGPDELFAVDSSSGNQALLRRIGLADGMGDPPCPPAGVGNPVKFSVPTLYPQILDASKFLRETYGLDDRIFGRRTADLADLTQFAEPCAYRVLGLRYLEMARSAGKDSADDFKAKSDLYRDLLRETLDRLAIHFKPTPLEAPRADLTRFGCRIAR